MNADDASALSTPSAQTELYYKILDSMSALPVEVRENEVVVSHHFFVMWKHSGVFASLTKHSNRRETKLCVENLGRIGP